MAKKIIQRAVSEDFQIKEDGKVIGTVRVKPSGLLWKPKSKQVWYGLTIEQFADFAEKKGKGQAK